MAKSNTQVTLGRIVKPVRDTLFLLIRRRKFEIEVKIGVDVRIASGETVRLPAGARWTCTVKSRDFPSRFHCKRHDRAVVVQA